ncbi:PilZ domain-containing protein [Erythrobacter sp. SCSIO 43205]|uniref:PilZ domain-containing protein n=1 Tax=Erythrobacter sp. SCSIO 43205 TaxID=2779361 RepID=UPI001CA88893|nr:PilZ domain-containing protein [Erythrobacter sp. SCSIO 43205]UAB78547.1 PilZ domain-containing protein [Erythrobacter sp. SCSIO 43205]
MAHKPDPALPASLACERASMLRVIKPRAARQNLLTRPAKLVTATGEFVCVIRNISKSGVKLHLFHDEPIGKIDELHTGSGQIARMRRVRQEGSDVAYEFVEKIDLDAFVSAVSPFPKRALRLALSFPVIVASRGRRFEATICDLSQHGARICCEGDFAIDQTLGIEGDWPGIGFGPVQGKVRWRRDSSFGLRLEKPMQLAEFAKLAARLQCPALLSCDES